MQNQAGSDSPIVLGPPQEANGFLRLFFPRTPSSPVTRYAFAAAACAVTFLVRLSLDPILQEHSPLLLFALAVAISAIRGGFGPGIVATISGGLAALYFFQPSGTFFPITSSYLVTGILQLLIFFLAGLILSWLGGELRRLRWQAVELAAQRSEILESITDGFQALDAEWRFVYLNKTAEQLVRGPGSEIIGKPVWGAIPELCGSPVERKFREVMTRRSAAHFEYLLASSNQWLEFHVYPAGNGGLTVYFTDIFDRKLVDLRLRDTLRERNAALEDVRKLTGLLPICAACKKIRDDRGNWQQLEAYISGHSNVKFSHGLCPDCAKRYFDELQRKGSLDR